MSAVVRSAPEADAIREQQRETWDRFSAGWKKWDATVLGWLEPFGRAMIEEVRPSAEATVLDVASGTGEPGLTIAGRVPRGRVVLTDLAEGMLDVTIEKATRRGLTNVRTKVCDAGALPFDDASFDAVTCRFGFMFFPDVATSVREFVRVSRPGARVCAAVWSEPAKNPWAADVMSTIGRYVALPTPAPGAPGLFRCAAPGSLRSTFAAAGLSDVVEREVTSDLIHETPERFWSFITDCAAPVVAGLARADEASRERIRDDVLERVRGYSRDGFVRLPSAAWVVCGTR
jgi:ubiquinone/menaquinone biosynthesis C-methylase UbiE